MGLLSMNAKIVCGLICMVDFSWSQDKKQPQKQDESNNKQVKDSNMYWYIPKVIQLYTQTENDVIEMKGFM